MPDSWDAAAGQTHFVGDGCTPPHQIAGEPGGFFNHGEEVNDRGSPGFGHGEKTKVPYGDLRAHIQHELPHLVDREVQDLAWALERLIEAFHPERVYVFGSQARGTPGPNSDFDLLIVVGDTDEPLHRLDQRGYGVLRPRRLPIELVFITRRDFESRLPALASLPATVAREGRLLYAA